MKTLWASCAVAAVLSGCTFCENTRDVEPPPPVTVVKTVQPINLDGVLNEKAWDAAPWHDLIFIDYYSELPPKEYARSLQDKYESSRARLLYDDKYLYVGAEFEDSDVMCYAQKDQGHHYRSSDVLEVFLWPEDAPHYWELYSTPAGFKTGFFFPGGGSMVSHFLGAAPIMPGLETASQIKGSLNVNNDRDQGWSTEMRIPLAELASKGVKFESGKKWRVLIARYNYSRYLWRRQSSSYPLLPKFNYHLRLYYSPVIFK